MGCYHGHGYQGHGCWGSGECRGGWREWEGYGPGYGHGRGYGYGYGPSFAGRYGALSRESAAAQLEAYLVSLKDEVRALEADLAEMRAGGEQGTTAPQV
jgi:hypothetical protein